MGRLELAQQALSAQAAEPGLGVVANGLGLNRVSGAVARLAQVDRGIVRAGQLAARVSGPCLPVAFLARESCEGAVVAGPRKVTSRPRLDLLTICTRAAGPCRYLTCGKGARGVQALVLQVENSGGRVDHLVPLGGVALDRVAEVIAIGSIVIFDRAHGPILCFLLRHV